MSSHFGEHFMIDGYGGVRGLLDNKELIRRLLEELPQKLNMIILNEPQVVLAPDRGGKDPGGWSGFVVIAESHISVHTFPRRGFVSADIYSCKNGMDTKYIENYFRDKFQLQDVETNFIKRGTRYPASNIHS